MTISGLLLALGCTEPELTPLPPEQTVLINAEPDDLNAPWELSGPETLFPGNGDTTITDLLSGTYTIHWGDVPDWNTPNPDSQILDLPAGGTITFTGNYTQIIVPAEFTFVDVTGGVFTMGSPLGELGSSEEERPQHEVTLDSFLMLATEVTQAQWRSVMGTDPAWFTGCDDCPVERVNWIQAIQFCNALSGDSLTFAYTIGATEVTFDPQATGFRLPTEAEWEYACRAGAITALANGDITVIGCNSDATLDQVGWYCGNASTSISETALKDPNVWGLYDMHGNVWEWVWDSYSDYTASPAVNPASPDTGSFKVIRGGSWLYGSQRCRSAYRKRASPGSLSSDLGFRVVRNAPSQPSQTPTIAPSPKPTSRERDRGKGGSP